VRVVIDTNVLVAAVRSKRGASFQVLSRIGTGAFDLAVSVPLVLEYEAALLRQLQVASLTADDMSTIVDYICLIAQHQPIFFLWRPLLRDPDDDMVAEVAIAGACDAVVTHNRRDFEGVAPLGVRVLSPADFLKEIGGSQ
jgi:putative PIN family toxin of toxin-antitoxin system